MVVYHLHRQGLPRVGPIYAELLLLTLVPTFGCAMIQRCNRSLLWIALHMSRWTAWMALGGKWFESGGLEETCELSGGHRGGGGGADRGGHEGMCGILEGVTTSALLLCHSSSFRRKGSKIVAVSSTTNNGSASLGTGRS